jgi:hypothetical protein
VGRTVPYPPLRKDLPTDAQSAGEDAQKARRSAAAKKAAETRKANRAKAPEPAGGATSTLGLMDRLLAGIRENLRPVPQPVRGLLGAAVVLVLLMGFAGLFIPWRSFGAYSGNFIVFLTLLVLLGGLVLTPRGWEELDKIRISSIKFLSVISIIAVACFLTLSVWHYYQEAVVSGPAGPNASRRSPNNTDTPRNDADASRLERSDSASTGSSDAAILEGDVRHAVTNLPLAGVILTLQDYYDLRGQTPKCESDTDGRFQFRDLRPSPGTLQRVRLVARKKGYELYDKYTTLGTTTVPVTLEPLNTAEKDP